GAWFFERSGEAARSGVVPDLDHRFGQPQTTELQLTHGRVHTDALYLRVVGKVLGGAFLDRTGHHDALGHDRHHHQRPHHVGHHDLKDRVVDEEQCDDHDREGQEEPTGAAARVDVVACVGTRLPVVLLAEVPFFALGGAGTSGVTL